MSRTETDVSPDPFDMSDIRTDSLVKVVLFSGASIRPWSAQHYFHHILPGEGSGKRSSVYGRVLDESEIAPEMRMTSDALYVTTGRTEDPQLAPLAQTYAIHADAIDCVADLSVNRHLVRPGRWQRSFS